MAEMYLSGARMVKRFLADLKPDVEMKPKFPRRATATNRAGIFYLRLPLEDTNLTTLTTTSETRITAAREEEIKVT